MRQTRSRITTIITTLLLLSFGAALTGCSRVSAGHVAVKSTLAGSGRGMADVASGPAWVPYNPFNESVMEYPIYVQTAVWTANKDEGHPINEEISFSTKDKMQVSADISLAYRLTPEKVPAFYLTFRTDDLNAYTHGFLHNLAREKFDTVAGTYTVDDVMGDNAPFLTAVRTALQNELTPYGVRLEQFGFIGSPRPPREWVAANTARITATQLAIQKQNEVVQATADADKAVAVARGESESTLTRARGQAEANRILGLSLTPSLVEYRKIDKWNGALPTYTGSGRGGILLTVPSTSK